MKKIIFIFLMTLFVFTARSYAQEGKPITVGQASAGPVEKAAAFTEKMRTELALNDDQVAKVKPINEHYFKSKIAAKDNGDATRTDLLKQEATILRNESLKNILSADQYSKFLTMIAKPSGPKSASQ